MEEEKSKHSQEQCDDSSVDDIALEDQNLSDIEVKVTSSIIHATNLMNSIRLFFDPKPAMSNSIDDPEPKKTNWWSASSKLFLKPFASKSTATKQTKIPDMTYRYSEPPMRPMSASHQIQFPRMSYNTQPTEGDTTQHNFHISSSWHHHADRMSASMNLPTTKESTMGSFKSPLTLSTHRQVHDTYKVITPVNSPKRAPASTDPVSPHSSAVVQKRPNLHLNLSIIKSAPSRPLVPSATGRVKKVTRDIAALDFLQNIPMSSEYYSSTNDASYLNSPVPHDSNEPGGVVMSDNEDDHALAGRRLPGPDCQVELNKQFREAHPWLHDSDLSLSKIRNLKQEALLMGQRIHLDISTVALACVYFEKLVLENPHFARLLKCMESNPRKYLGEDIFSFYSKLVHDEVVAPLHRTDDDDLDDDDDCTDGEHLLSDAEELEDEPTETGRTSLFPWNQVSFTQWWKDRT
ncbi:hypothetical protein DYB32_010165 [Aphanomyces invadans]|uniref:Uncharacterized protein n=1 Tax=Aphanomyces invadans TaxID=157072 RepID=A0A418AG85_9STRA|nr:hypothetical protein DYB32_010165 [Aphanomyces invadans]